MEDFGSKYSKRTPSKDCGHDPETRNKFNREQENYAIYNHAVGKIFLQKINKVSAEAEGRENNESYIDENDIYQIDNISLDEKKEKIE